MWWEAGSPKLGPGARARIAHPDTAVYVSAASPWEIAVKASSGRLEVAVERALAIDEDGFLELPITIAHARRSVALPLHHRDPFDRLLVAQAQLEKLTLVTADDRIGAYDVDVLDASV